MVKTRGQLMKMRWGSTSRSRSRSRSRRSKSRSRQRQRVYQHLDDVQLRFHKNNMKAIVEMYKDMSHKDLRKAKRDLRNLRKEMKMRGL